MPLWWGLLCNLRWNRGDSPESPKYKNGKSADYIPQLARVNPEQYGISICTIDGQRFNIGDSNVDFTVQSCFKPINYGIVLEELGET